MATRVCVKNLPKGCDERQLKKHFEKFGPLSDVKLMRTGYPLCLRGGSKEWCREGISRGFGFIGFLDPSKGMEAIQYFDKTFIGSRRISVEVARKVGDSALARPWSKYSKGSSRYRAMHPEPPQPKPPSQPTPADEEDPELQAFLDLMMPEKKTAKWEDTTLQDTAPEKQTKRKRTEEAVMDPEPDLAHEGEGVRLFVRNLAYGVTESDLVECFSPYGDLTEVHIVIDKETEKSKGLAFVEFEEAACAAAARGDLDGSIFQGRLMHVLPSQEKRRRATPMKQCPTDSTINSSYKREKEAQLKEHAGNRVAWNTFYIRPDAITEAVAEHYGLSKSDLMNRDASDLGVRLALGETQVLSKIKEDLENAGVNVEQLEAAAGASGKAATSQSIPRSNSTLIVKNLPYHANREELLEMFSVYGEIERFVTPESCVLAIIQFQHPDHARAAFRGLAYKRYRSVPIYLEWAPLHTLITPETASHPDPEEEASGLTLYVKNLSFSTKDSDLAQHFDIAASEIGGQLRSARVARRSHSNGTIVSAGYGFVEVNSEDVAKYLTQKLQNSVLDGHILQIRRSQRRSESTPQSHPLPEDPTSAKLIVKNLAFECTRQDVMSLFSPYGHIQSCRLPKKFDGSHRGFAFIQFMTKQESRTALDKVQGAHLYGRRLNVDFAKEERDA